MQSTSLIQRGHGEREIRTSRRGVCEERGKRNTDGRVAKTEQQRDDHKGRGDRVTFSGGLIRRLLTADSYGDFQRRTHKATFNGGLIRRHSTADSYGDIQRRIHTATFCGGLIRRFLRADSYGEIQRQTHTATFNGGLILRYGGPVRRQVVADSQGDTQTDAERGGRTEADSGGENRRTYKTARDDTTRRHYSREAVTVQGHKAGFQIRTQLH